LSLLERGAILLAALGLTIGLIALLSGFFAGNDQASLAAPPSITGRQFRDLGDAQLRPGQRRPRYDSAPPTSGAHFPAPVTAEDASLNNDQLLTALAAGDVVILYGTPQPPSGLTTLAQALAPGFTPALAQAGQAVIMGRRPGTAGLVGLAWTHLIRVHQPLDPRLREFAAYWLGHGAPHRPGQRRKR
jgi:Protein of unknown function (DUF3105)